MPARRREEVLSDPGATAGRFFQRISAAPRAAGVSVDQRPEWRTVPRAQPLKWLLTKASTGTRTRSTRDHLHVVGHLAGAVDSDVVQRRGQGLYGHAISW